MKKDYAHVSILLDRSGSMSSIKNDVIGGFNNFIEDQKKVPGEMSVTLMSFSSHKDTTTIYDMVKLNTINPLTTENYHTTGSTALNDSFAQLIEETGKRLANISDADRPEKVLFVCITDGEENDSKEHSTEALKKIIDHQRDKYNWEFIYIGANQDSFAEAQKRGILRSANFKADSAGTTRAYASLSADTVKYRKGQDF
jgi:hypothetical protein